MHFSQAKRFAKYRTQNDRKVPLTRREHLNHVVEDYVENIWGDLNYF